VVPIFVTVALIQTPACAANHRYVATELCGVPVYTLAFTGSKLYWLVTDRSTWV